LNLVNETIDTDAAIYHLLMVLDGIGYEVGTILGEATDTVTLYSEEVSIGVVVGALA